MNSENSVSLLLLETTAVWPSWGKELRSRGKSARVEVQQDGESLAEFHQRIFEVLNKIEDEGQVLSCAAYSCSTDSTQLVLEGRLRLGARMLQMMQAAALTVEMPSTPERMALLDERDDQPASEPEFILAGGAWATTGHEGLARLAMMDLWGALSASVQGAKVSVRFERAETTQRNLASVGLMGARLESERPAGRESAAVPESAVPESAAVRERAAITKRTPLAAGSAAEDQAADAQAASSHAQQSEADSTGSERGADSERAAGSRRSERAWTEPKYSSHAQRRRVGEELEGASARGAMPDSGVSRRARDRMPRSSLSSAPSAASAPSVPSASASSVPSASVPSASTPSVPASSVPASSVPVHLSAQVFDSSPSASESALSSAPATVPSPLRPVVRAYSRGGVSERPRGTHLGRPDARKEAALREAASGGRARMESFDDSSKS